MNPTFTVQQVKGMAPDMVIPAVVGNLVGVNPKKSGTTRAGKPYTVQGFKLQEGNDFILGSAWDFMDLDQYLNQRIVFASIKGRNNRLGGVSLKGVQGQNGKTYINLAVSESGVLHTPESYQAVQAVATNQPKQQDGPAPDQRQAVLPSVAQQTSAVSRGYAQAQPPPQVQQEPPKPIMGQTVGMAINNAVEVWNSNFAETQGYDFETFVHEYASKIIRVAQKLERGELYVSLIDQVQSNKPEFAPPPAGWRPLESTSPKPPQEQHPDQYAAVDDTDHNSEDVPF